MRMTRTPREILLASALVLVAAAAVGQAARDGARQTHGSTWPDSPVARVEALALLETLNADLLSNDSATLTLERWCDSHKMATPAKIIAERVHDADKEPTAEVRQLLGVGSAEPVRYRHVRLHCGQHVFSEADNWYVPARLTPEMNQLLDTSDTPFGRVVQELHFHRRTLAARLLWSPLPASWEMARALPRGGKEPLQLPAEIIQHRAVLSLPDGTPFSALVETYTGEVLDFPAPPQP
jgi:chorismate-pyruvate lyase